MENVEFLQDLGMSPNEAKVYTALLSLGPSKITKIANRAGLHPKNAYEALERLSAKGIASHLIERNAKVFRAESPLKLRNLLAEKTNELDLRMPELLAAYRTAEQPREVTMLRGIGGIRAQWDAIASEESGKTCRIFAPHEMEFFAKEPMRLRLRKEYMRFHKARKVVQLIHLDTPLCRANCRAFDKGLGRTIKRRFLADISKSDVAFVTLRDITFLNFFAGGEQLYVRIKSAELARMFQNAFDILWKQAKP